MSHLRLVPPCPEMTEDEHRWQRVWVEFADRLSGERQERHDEAATVARIYVARARGNVIPLGSRRPPLPPAAA